MGMSQYGGGVIRDLTDASPGEYEGCAPRF